MTSAQPTLDFTVPAQLIDRLAERLAQRTVEQLATRLTDPQTLISPWLTVDQACIYLGFSRDTLYKLTAAKAISFRKKQGGQGLRFHRDELDAWMETQYPRLDRLG